MIGGQGFMLFRDDKTGAQGYSRTGVSDALSTQRRLYRSISTQEVYGGMPDELDHPEYWDDWSGGALNYRADQSEPEHYHLGINMDTRFPHLAFPCQAPQVLAARYASGAGNADFFIDVPLPGTGNVPPAGAGAVLAVGKNFIASFVPTVFQNTAGSAFDFLMEASAGNYGYRPATFGSFTYIPCTDGSAFLRRANDGATYTTSIMPASWFAVANGRLWRDWAPSGGPAAVLQSVAIGTDPMVTSNWSASINIGNGQLPSKDAVAFESNILAGLPDGLYLGDQSGTFTNVATDIADSINVDNARDLTVQNGMVCFAAGANIWGYKPSSGSNSVMRQLWPITDAKTFSSMWSSADQPDQYYANGGAAGSVNLAGLKALGRVEALTGFGRWLYAGIFTGSHSFVYCGTEASAGLPYVWHPMQFIRGAKIRRLHVDSISTASSGKPIPQRMWVATDASFASQVGGSAPIYYWPIPEGDFTPMSDTSFSPNYAFASYLEQSMTDSGAPGTWKAWRRLDYWTEGLGASVGDKKWMVPIRAVLDASIINNPTMFQPGGNVGSGAMLTTSPYGFAYWNNLNLSAVSQQIQVGWGFQGQATGGRLNPAIMHSIVSRGAFRPLTADTITCQVRCFDNDKDREGSDMPPAENQIQYLRSLSKQFSPSFFVDIVGAAVGALVVPPIEEKEIYQGGKDYPELVATVKIGVLANGWNLDVENAAPPPPPSPPVSGTNDTLAMYTNDQLATMTNTQLQGL